MKSVTVLTPTYNRAYKLINCYDSLLNQTCSDFEWIIVDDGSTDNTEELVSKWIDDNRLDIHYIKKENGGKHTALNIGFKLADSKYLIILDSDDKLTENAIEIIISTWKKHQYNNSLGVIVFLRGYTTGEIVGSKFVCPNIAMSRFKQKQVGDKAETIRTDVINRYRFPVIRGERFLAEGIMWNRIAKDYQYLYSNETIYECEYLEDGLSRSVKRLSITNPRGAMLLNNEKMVLPYSSVTILKSVVLYGTYGLFAGESTISIIKGSNRKILSAFELPLSWLLYKCWGRMYA